MEAEERLDKMKGYKNKMAEFAATAKMTDEDLKNPDYKPSILNLLHFPTFEGSYFCVPKINEMIAEQHLKVNYEKVNPSKFFGTAFVIFEELEMQRRVLKFEQSCLMKCRCSERDFGSLKIFQAPEPSDIIWKNLGVSKCEFLKRKFVSNLVLFLLLCTVFGFMLALNTYKRKYQEKQLNDPNQQSMSLIMQVQLNGISVGLSVVLYIGNFLIGKAVYKFADYERHKTHSGRT